MAYTTQNTLLLNKLMDFYDKDNNLDKMLSIINGESKISLRIVDWFATNYAKKYYTIYTLKNTSKRFKVYMDYKLKLKAYSKKRFDPFCRWDRINIPYKDGAFIQTTIGQLNFFKWAINTCIIDYIKDIKNDIEDDMNYSLKCVKDKDKKNKNGRKSRQELSKSALRGLNKNKLSVCITFT